MHKVSIFFLISVFSIINGSAISKSNSDHWELASDKIKDICNSVKDLSIPAQDRPDEETKKSMRECNSGEPYYGFESPPDYVKARHCAIVNHHYDILALIYANGKGVKPNLDLAIHFVCVYGGSTHEINSRVKQLIKRKQHNNAQKDFSMCDYATTREETAFCSSLDQDYANARHNKYLTALDKILTPPQKKALQKLQNTFTAYSDMRIEHEMDRFGSGALSGGIEEQIALKDNMMTLLDQTIQCKLPSYTSKQYQKADKRLNFLYKKTQSKPEEPDITTRGGIKKTERTWIHYKDSWVNFGHTTCPNISENTWKTLITKERIIQLKELAGP